MAYEPTNWKTGDVVTSAKLNKIEQGIASGGGMMQCVIKEEPDTGDLVADKPFADVYNAIFSGETVQIYIDGNPALSPLVGGDGTAQNPYSIAFLEFGVDTNRDYQPTGLHVGCYVWTEADGVQWRGDSVATLTPSE